MTFWSAILDLAAIPARLLATARGTAPRGAMALPRSHAEVIATFGNPGTGSAALTAWVAANIVTCRDVNGTRGFPSMPGVPRRFYFETHRLVEVRMRAAFDAARAAAPGYAVERAASFVFRHERHDPARPLSLHSWGIAVDIDSETNAAHDYADERAPVPWSDEWMRRWPRGLPREFVEAFESVGFVWGGRWPSFKDPMHFQLARS